LILGCGQAAIGLTKNKHCPDGATALQDVEELRPVIDGATALQEVLPNNSEIGDTLTKFAGPLAQGVLDLGMSFLVD